jgi:hypothetical protein
MTIANLLTSLASVFIALGLACVVLRAVRRPAGQPFFQEVSPGYCRADLEALTRRAEARAGADPHGLRRPLFFQSVRSPSVRCEADGGDQVHPGSSAVRCRDCDLCAGPCLRDEIRRAFDKASCDACLEMGHG